jgi:hypothetical protein
MLVCSFPAIENFQDDLHATDVQVALTLSLFILVQGIIPMGWSSVSEIRVKTVGPRLSFCHEC